jgi:serine/threonine protein kinase
MATERSRRGLAPGKRFAGKFLLEENFASGSMGAVWRARDTQRDIPVAIKVMMASIADSPGFAQRFEREASSAAQIGSPNVVNIYEYGVHNSQPYIVMELLKGEDLHQRFKRVTRLSVRATSRLVRGICEGLHAAHESGIIHRDLKPANIFLAREGDAEFVKLLDFGIAKVIQDEGTGITATGQMIGTPNYMSPEQIQGAKFVDARCDLWAVAVIAFRALTGQLPFNGHTVQVIRAILHQSPPVPSSIAEDLSLEIDEFFDRAMAHNVDNRFQSAREMADALAQIAKKEPRDSGAEPSPLSLDPAARMSAAPPAPAGPKAPSSWRNNAPPPPIQITKDDGPPSSMRPPVPVDAPLLPVQLAARESTPGGPPPSARPGEQPSAANPEERPAFPSVPSLIPSAPRTPKGPSWVLWVSAVLFVIGVTALVAALTAWQK